MNVVAEKYTKSESQGIGFITPTSEMRVLFFFMLASRNESRSRLNMRYIILWIAIFLVFFNCCCSMDFSIISFPYSDKRKSMEFLRGQLSSGIFLPSAVFDYRF